MRIQRLGIEAMGSQLVAYFATLSASFPFAIVAFAFLHVALGSIAKNSRKNVHQPSVHVTGKYHRFIGDLKS